MQTEHVTTPADMSMSPPLLILFSIPQSTYSHHPHHAYLRGAQSSQADQLPEPHCHEVSAFASLLIILQLLLAEQGSNAWRECALTCQQPIDGKVPHLYITTGEGGCRYLSAWATHSACAARVVHLQCIVVHCYYALHTPSVSHFAICTMHKTKL